jgi:hypothetical protein
MSIATIPLSILRFQYQLVRFPLEVIEERLVARMGAEAPVRLVYERSLGVLDATVGSVLGDPRLKRQGASLAKRSDELARAARLDAAASQDLKQADADYKASRQEAAEDLQDARAAKKDAVEGARNTAETRKRAAMERAEKSATAAKQQADDVAARRKEAAREAERRDLDRIQTAERQATGAATTKLDDARTKRQEAGAKRAQADRVEQLADVEKQARQAKRSK